MRYTKIDVECVNLKSSTYESSENLTVRDLIKILKDFDQDAIVTIYDNGGGELPLRDIVTQTFAGEKYVTLNDSHRYISNPDKFTMSEIEIN